MIEFNLQMFAKSAAYQSGRRKSIAIDRAKKEEGAVKERIEKEEKIAREKGQKLGEAVSAVSARETYELYRVANGKETPVVRDGATVTRTGAEVLNKMTYNKRLGVWVSKDKGYKYKVRKR